MFEHLRGLLRDHMGDTRAQAPRRSAEEERRLAAAVLLLEVARADYRHAPAERAALRAGLARDFGVPEAALDALLDQAELRAKQSVSLFDFVQTLNRTLAPEDKRGLLRLLWDVAHADGKVDAHEEHLIRRLADLLHLPHADFIRARLDAGRKP
ncbi:MAG: TerB family tellurite resistance protein [Gammaproteobacteria bacterium]